MTWNYRVIHTVINDEHFFDIHEVYYDDNGEPKFVTEDSVAPMGNTLDELKEDLQHYLLALSKPILEYDSFLKDKNNNDLTK